MRDDSTSTKPAIEVASVDDPENENGALVVIDVVHDSKVSDPEAMECV